MSRPVVAITGASRGIGHAAAMRFAAQGAWLALNFHDTEERIPEVVEAAVACGGRVFAHRADIADPLQAAGFIEAAEHAYGRLDVLVNNAGILHAVDTVDETWAAFQRTLAVNLGGTFSTMRAALPGMLRRGSGRIVNVASELGLIGFPGYAAYCASKGGVIAMTKSIAKEVAARGVLVNCVAPGPVETRMLVEDTVEFNDETRQQVPLQRFGQPDEIAAVIEFLAGPGASFMVGQVVSPNGGTAI